MVYNFKKFESVNKKTEDKITVTKSHSIGFPSKFYSDNHIKDFNYVVLFYDQEQKAIAVHFTNSEEEKSKFTIIRPKQNATGGAIIARSFFKTYNIDPAKFANRYEYTKDEIEGVGRVFVIELKERLQITENEKPVTESKVETLGT